MKQKTDDAILGMLFERDESALQEIQTAYGKLCYRLANDILNNREDSEECVNDMLLKVWSTIPPKHPDSLIAYIITIIRNTAVNRYLAAKTQKRGGRQFEAAWEELETTLESDENLHDTVETHELTREIERFLDTLTPRTRNIFLRRYYMSESISEIADTYGMGVSAVKISLMRTRDKLKKYLREEGLL
ncbi:MAG: sigma-70 family RNA polymerase sigma factor [Oscillospiraceae bacterium]|nr:sigma-70 family RNA polymerase sigma factor [Oscillospiraceae bacterium]